MMTLEINGESFVLETHLGAIKRMEAALGGVQAFGVLQQIDSATAGELCNILYAGFPNARKEEAARFKRLSDESWGMFEIFEAAKTLLIHMMFTGTDEQKEARMAQLNMPDERKNEVRELLGMEAPC
jgi:hypothetical protein